MPEEYDLTEEELKRVAETIKNDQRTDIKVIKQKENKNFKKLKELPIVKKKGGALPWQKKQKKYAVRKNYKEEMYKEIEKDEPDLEKIKEYAEKVKRGDVEEYRPIKSPYLELIRADGSKEYWEGVKAGVLEITRSDEKTAYINLRKDKLLTDTIRNYDDSSVQGWICYENDQNPLPQNVALDSHEYFSNLKEIMTNQKDVQTQRLTAMSGLVWNIGIALVIIVAVVLVGVPFLTGENIFEMIDKAKDNTQTNNNTTQYTAEELQILEEIKKQRLDAGTTGEG